MCGSQSEENGLAHTRAKRHASTMTARHDTQDRSVEAAGREPSREEAVLNAAATLFAEKGYAATSIRDIGERVGLLGGSLYHYIKSKDALFVRIHDRALQSAEDAIRAGIADIEDPVQRLASACRILLAIQLAPDSLTMPLMNDLGSVPEGLRERLIERRDAFETMFAELIAAVPPVAGRDPDIYRLLLLTTLNTASNWYRPGRLTSDEVADQILATYGIDPGGA